MPTGLDVLRAADALRNCMQAHADDSRFERYRGGIRGFILQLSQARNRVSEDATGPAIDVAERKLKSVLDLCQALSPTDQAVTDFGVEAERALDALEAAGDGAEMPSKARTFALQGALRFERPSTGRRHSRAEGLEDAGGGGEANYYNKLITLFPAEALTVYGVGVAVFGSSTLPALLVCLAILVALRWIANKPATGGATSKPPVFVAAVSFLLWTTATDPGWLSETGLFTDEGLVDAQKWAAFLGAAFVVIAPAFVPAASPQEG